MATARKSLRYRVRGRRDRFRSGAADRLVFAHRHRLTSSRACIATTIWRGRSRSSPCTAEGMPEVSDDFRVWTVRSKPRNLLSGRSRVSKASSASSSPQTTCIPTNASSIRAGSRPLLRVLSELKIVGHGRSCARRRLKGKQAVRLRHGSRRNACARSLHAAVQIRRAATALHRDAWRHAALWGAVAREVVEMYGDADARTSGWHGAVSAGRVAALVAHRPGTQSDLSRSSCMTQNQMPTTPRARRCCKSFKGRRLPMIDRVEISIIEEVQPRWLSFLEQTVRLCPGWCRTTSSTSPRPTAS